MGYLAAIVLVVGVGLWIIGAAFVALFRAIGAAAETTDQAVGAFTGWLGRKHLGAVAFIPVELQPARKEPPKATDASYGRRRRFQPAPAAPELPVVLPAVDVETIELQNYDPSVPLPSISPAAVFKPEIDAALSASLDDERPSHTVDVDSVRSILGTTPSLPYESLFARLGRRPEYPVQPPTVLGFPKPPSFTPWVIDIAEPHFEPPYYGARLSSLNRFVDAAHAQEKRRVDAARQVKEELLARCSLRNAEVKRLAAVAQARFETGVAKQRARLEAAKEQHARGRESYLAAFQAEQLLLHDRKALLDSAGSDGLMARVDAAIRTMRIPAFVSRCGESRFDPESGILIHEHRFPELASIEWQKRVQLKAGLASKPANQRERKDAAAQVYPALCVRLACELIRLDLHSEVKAVAINGWADYTEKATGQSKRAYCASLFATKEQLLSLRPDLLEPIEAFAALKGIAARTLEVTPIAPVIRLETHDKRFVDGREVLATMAAGENLASMDWADFEHLCRQLFEKAFAGSGAEVKVTQASRDQGVDAIIFDPDPLRGGKIVVQAKRYTNLVDVSAVRDLYGTVHNEGAIKGILVTTSRYGPDSYAFAKGKPLTLIDGSQLLGLLEQHGYTFRIDLAEARKALGR